MKKYILLAFLILLTPFAIQAQYSPDITLTSPTAIWTDVRAYGSIIDALTAIGSNKQTLVIPNEQVVNSLSFKSSGTK